jgi:hypothetical protein
MSTRIQFEMGSIRARGAANSTLVVGFALVCLILAGCDKRARINADYEFVQPQSYSIEPGSPACALYYKGKKVWRSVLMGDDKTCRDGIFVFMSTVPDSEGECNVYPQLFAIRGAGPPVILSERILNQPFKAGNRHVAGSTYDVDFITPIATGIRVVFNVGVTKNGEDVMTTNDVSWPDIESWTREAETSAPLQIAPLGNYRVLPMQQSNTPSNSTTPKN